MKETIIVNGQLYDCQVSKSDCCNKGLKAYLAEEPGRSEMEQVGVVLLLLASPYASKAAISLSL